MRNLNSILMLACLSSTACKPTEPDTAESPYAFRTDAGREPIADAAAPAGPDVDWAGVAADVAASAAEGTLALAAVDTLLAAFITKGNELDPIRGAAPNAAQIAGRLRSQLCTTSTVTYKADAEYVTVDLGTSCRLSGSGLVASGTILVGLRAATDGKPWAAIDLQLSKVGIQGYTLDGFVTVTTNGKTDTLDTRVRVAGLGAITFRGTGDAENDGAAVTLDGTGTWTGKAHSTPLTADGWQCLSSSQSVLTTRKVRKSAADCYAASGSLTVITPWACSLGTDPAATQRRTLVATSTVTFLPTTPATGGATIGVSVANAAGNSTIATGTPVALTAQACPDGAPR